MSRQHRKYLEQKTKIKSDNEASNIRHMGQIKTGTMEPQTVPQSAPRMDARQSIRSTIIIADSTTPILLLLSPPKVFISGKDYCNGG